MHKTLQKQEVNNQLERVQKGTQNVDLRDTADAVAAHSQRIVAEFTQAALQTKVDIRGEPNSMCWECGKVDRCLCENNTLTKPGRKIRKTRIRKQK